MAGVARRVSRAARGVANVGAVAARFVDEEAAFDEPYNNRLHLTAPRERVQMQPAVNECRVWGHCPARIIARLQGCSVPFTAG